MWKQHVPSIAGTQKVMKHNFGQAERGREDKNVELLASAKSRRGP